jgi:hypothetical protein
MSRSVATFPRSVSRGEALALLRYEDGGGMWCGPRWFPETYAELDGRGVTLALAHAATRWIIGCALAPKQWESPSA